MSSSCGVAYGSAVVVPIGRPATRVYSSGRGQGLACGPPVYQEKTARPEACTLFGLGDLRHIWRPCTLVPEGGPVSPWSRCLPTWHCTPPPWPAPHPPP